MKHEMLHPGLCQQPFIFCVTQGKDTAVPHDLLFPMQRAEQGREICTDSSLVAEEGYKRVVGASMTHATA